MSNSHWQHKSCLQQKLYIISYTQCLDYVVDLVLCLGACSRHGVNCCTNQLVQSNHLPLDLWTSLHAKPSDSAASQLQQGQQTAHPYGELWSQQYAATGGNTFGIHTRSFATMTSTSGDTDRRSYGTGASYINLSVSHLTAH